MNKLLFIITLSALFASCTVNTIDEHIVVMESESGTVCNLEYTDQINSNKPNKKSIVIEKERSAFVNLINIFYRGGSTPPTEAVYTLTREKGNGSCTVYILNDINHSDSISNKWYMQMGQPDYTPTDENMAWVRATAKSVLTVDSATKSCDIAVRF